MILFQVYGIELVMYLTYPSFELQKEDCHFELYPKNNNYLLDRLMFLLMLLMCNLFVSFLDYKLLN